MLTREKIEVRDDLTILVGNAAIAVSSPAEGFQIAEKLIRQSARRALAEEAAAGELLAHADGTRQ